jgi:hypothetical protein
VADDHPKTIYDHDLDMSRDDGIDENGIVWFSRCHHVEFALWNKMRKYHEFYPSLITNLTQHDSHGLFDDHSKTFDYHHLDMS